MTQLLEPHATPPRLISAEPFDARAGDWTAVDWVPPGGILTRLLPVPLRDLLR